MNHSLTTHEPCTYPPTYSLTNSLIHPFIDSLLTHWLNHSFINLHSPKNHGSSRQMNRYHHMVLRDQDNKYLVIRSWWLLKHVLFAIQTFHRERGYIWLSDRRVSLQMRCGKSTWYWTHTPTPNPTPHVRWVQISRRSCGRVSCAHIACKDWPQFYLLLIASLAFLRRVLFKEFLDLWDKRLTIA